MKRIIGIPNKKAEQEKETPVPKPKPVKPTLSDVVTKIDVKAEDLDKKIASCDLELQKIATRLRSLPDGSIKNALKMKAYGILQRKKKFDKQADIFKQQSFNFEQTSININATKDAVTIVKGMKDGIKELKKTQNTIDVDSIEDLHDEMQSLFEKSEDIQETFANTRNLPEIDDQELEEQLELLGDEFVADNDASYLDAAAVADATAISKPNTPGGLDPGNSHLLASSDKNSINALPPPTSGSKADLCRAPPITFTGDLMFNEEEFNSANWGSPFNARKNPFN